MSADPARKHLKAFTVHDLPRDLVEAADAHMKGLRITEWRKKLTAGMLQFIRRGVFPPEFLRLVCAEGAVAKAGGTLYTDHAALLTALRTALAAFTQEVNSAQESGRTDENGGRRPETSQ